MENNFEKFLAAYQRSNDQIKQIIDSEEIGLFVTKELLGTHPQQKQKFTILVSNLLLGVITEDELLSNLLNLGITQTDVKSHFEKITSYVKNVINPPGNNKTIEKEIAEAEVALRAIPALRTMSGNHEFTPESGEPVYSTTQSAIINESLHVLSQAAPLPSTPPAPATPTTAHPAPGRWDSEPS